MTAVLVNNVNMVSLFCLVIVFYLFAACVMVMCRLQRTVRQLGFFQCCKWVVYFMELYHVGFVCSKFQSHTQS